MHWLGNLPVTSKYSPTGVFQEPCIANFNGTLLSLDGNLGRNAGRLRGPSSTTCAYRKHVRSASACSLELIVDMFNIANRYNVAAVSPLFTNAGQATAAYDPRQFQFGMKVKW